MKLTFKVTFIALAMTVMAVWAPNARAQSDTLVVPWADNSGNLVIDTLYNTIMGDTLADGTRKNPNRVYLLQRGGEYWNDMTIKNQDRSGNPFTLRLVGQSPDPTDPLGNPPTLQLLSTNGQTHIMQGYGDVYFKNLYIIECDEKGNQSSYYQTIEFDGGNTHSVFDSCIFERANFATVAYTTKNNTLTFTNCEFRNLVEYPMTQEWTGRGISCWADEDSVIVENCTFFNVGMCALQIEGGAANYVRFNHNTLVDVGHGINSGYSGPWWKEAYFTNNLFINQYWHGESNLEYSLTLNPSRYWGPLSGMFTVGPLPAQYGADLGRRIAFAYNAGYLDSYFTNAYGDSVRMQPFTNAYTDSFFNTYSPANGGQMVNSNNVMLSAYPKFPQAMIDSLNALAPVQWESIVDVRNAIANPPSYFYDYNPTTTTVYTNPTWPRKENFAYTDASLMSGKTSDNLPLGDLNWFPSSLATFNANKAQYVKGVETIPGKQFFFVVDTLAQAEDGAVGGTATVKATPGLTYYTQSNGAGTITWTFTAKEAGQYDTKWYVNETGRGQSGPCLAIDGQQFVDKAHGWGQFVLDSLLGPAKGLSKTDWIWVPIVADSMILSSPGPFGDPATSLFTFAAGSQHTIGVTGGGWGEVRFSEIDLVVHGGTDTVKLKAPDAVTTLVTPGAVGVDWVASGFKYDSLGSSGTITWTLTNSRAGSYAISVNYQNTESNTTAQLKVDNGSPMNINLPMNPDGQGHSVLSDVVNLAAGSHTVVLSGSGANIDFIQLQEKVTGIKQIDSKVPTKFVLQQNYPNPFNPTTTINYSIPHRADVSLEIYNVLGQKVATLFSGVQGPGTYQYSFNAARFASGVYFYRLEAGSTVITKKMMLIK